MTWIFGSRTLDLFITPLHGSRLTGVVSVAIFDDPIPRTDDVAVSGRVNPTVLVHRVPAAIACSGPIIIWMAVVADHLVFPFIPILRVIPTLEPLRSLDDGRVGLKLISELQLGSPSRKSLAYAKDPPSNPVTKNQQCQNRLLRLEGAILRQARLDGALLMEANLSRADLFGATLIGADLRGAKASRAFLKRADLNGADLSTTIGITQDQIGEASGDRDTRLPEGVERLAHWQKVHATR